VFVATNIAAKAPVAPFRAEKPGKEKRMSDATKGDLVNPHDDLSKNPVGLEPQLRFAELAPRED
jgi:hypothetical protein